MRRPSSADSAILKVERAAERILEVSKILREDRPFSYVVETDTMARERATCAKKNEAAVDRISLTAGEALQHLSSALDYAYWAIVSPYASTPREAKATQFPFSERADRLSEAVKNRLANRVSDRFFDAIISLRPHGEEGGNSLLYLIHSLNAPEKHRDLTPMAHYTALDTVLTRKQVPDFPPELGGIAHMIDVGKDVVWPFRFTAGMDLGRVVPPTTCVFEKEIDIPVQIVFPIRALNGAAPVVPTLNKLVDVAKETIGVMREAAAS